MPKVGLGQLLRMTRWPALAGVAAVGALLAGCGGASGATAGPPTITLYSGQHQQTTEQLVSGFEAKSGVRVLVRYDDEDTLADEIVAEAGHPKADVIYTENSPALEYLQERGLLAPVDAATLRKTPAKYDSPKGDWVGVSARVSVVVYNPALIGRSELPSHVLGMAEPMYKGKIAIAPGETDFQPIVTAVERAYGERRALAWLHGLKANAGSHVYPDNETLTAEVNRGVVAFGVVNQYYWYRLAAEVGKANMHSKITYFVPRDPGYVVDVSGAAVLGSSRHKAAAQRFLAFLVSKQGQEIIARSQSYEYPLDDGVRPGAPETPFADLRPYPVTVAQLGDGSLAISLLQKAGLL
jgi:iron(III) transport system substrate-binding protein